MYTVLNKPVNVYVIGKESHGSYGEFRPAIYPSY